MRLTVWVEGWQHDCCGEPFSIGSTVRWTLAEPDREYVDPLFRPDLSVEIDRAEDRHGVLTDLDTPDTVGTVTAIRSVQVRYAPRVDDDGVVWTPVPGSAELTDVDRSNGDEMRSEDFTGYLVERFLPRTVTRTPPHPDALVTNAARRRAGQPHRRWSWAGWLSMVAS